MCVSIAHWMIMGYISRMGDLHMPEHVSKVVVVDGRGPIIQLPAYSTAKKVSWTWAEPNSPIVMIDYRREVIEAFGQGGLQDFLQVVGIAAIVQFQIGEGTGLVELKDAEIDSDKALALYHMPAGDYIQNQQIFDSRIGFRHKSRDSKYMYMALIRKSRSLKD